LTLIIGCFTIDRWKGGIPVKAFLLAYFLSLPPVPVGLYLETPYSGLEVAEVYKVKGYYCYLKNPDTGVGYPDLPFSRAEVWMLFGKERK
jgi:hypothetical protein